VPGKSRGFRAIRRYSMTERGPQPSAAPGLPLLGRVAHTAKTLLAHYVIWKLRTGYTNLP